MQWTILRQAKVQTMCTCTVAIIRKNSSRIWPYLNMDNCKMKKGYLFKHVAKLIKPQTLLSSYQYEYYQRLHHVDLFMNVLLCFIF